MSLQASGSENEQVFNDKAGREGKREWLGMAV
jgi:hypothetical protein